MKVFACLDRPVRIPDFVEPEGAWTQDAVAKAALQLILAKLGFGADFGASSCHCSSSSLVHP